MHGGLETQPGAHDADRQAEVAGRADRNLVLAEELPGLVAGQFPVIAVEVDQAGLQGQVFGMLEHFMNTAAGLDRTRDRQLAVGLEPE
ncbi:hypothetical protein D3C75_982480 [compost metagenome]